MNLLFFILFAFASSHESFVEFNELEALKQIIKEASAIQIAAEADLPLEFLNGQTAFPHEYFFQNNFTHTTYFRPKCPIDLSIIDPVYWCRGLKTKVPIVDSYIVRTYKEAFEYLGNDQAEILLYLSKQGELVQKLIAEARRHIKELMSFQETCLEPEFYQIEPKIHKFWLTKKENPREIPKEFQEFIVKECENLGVHWEIVVWVTHFDLHEESLEYLRSNAGCRVTPKSVYSVPAFEPFLYLIDSSEFSNAITMMKYSLHKVEPGFYEDMDCWTSASLDYFLQFKSLVVYNPETNFIMDFFFYASEGKIENICQLYDKREKQFVFGEENVVISGQLHSFLRHEKVPENSWVKQENVNVQPTTVLFQRVREETQKIYV